MRFGTGSRETVRLLNNERRLIEENAKLKLKLHHYQGAFARLDAIIDSEPKNGIVNVVTFKAHISKVLSQTLERIGKGRE